MITQKIDPSSFTNIPPIGAFGEASIARSTSNQNIRAVKHMRQGEFDAAVCILRSLVLKSGCTWMRPEVPNFVKRNFATALLLAGHPSGCLDMLAEMRDETQPRVRQLRAAIKQWEATLSFFQWLNWRTGRIEPSNRPVTIEFVPGELEDESPRADTTQSSSNATHLSTAL